MEENLKRMNQLKANLDLSFLNSSQKQTVIGDQIIRDKKEELIFFKLNPIDHIDYNNGTNSLSWTPHQFNRLIARRSKAFKK
jgi:hypothetical protein